MPTYRDPVHGVSDAEALAEAAAIAPLTSTVVRMFEIYHPLGTPDGPLYLTNAGTSIMAKKEADAARDPGEYVEWLGTKIVDARPEESDTDSSPEIALTVANVSGAASDALRRAVGSREQWEIIERIYIAEGADAPARLPPAKMVITGFDISTDVVTLRASFGDSGNIAVPRITFRRDQYPGLKR